MAARKQETLSQETAAGSTFWRQSSSAIPGRVNPAKSGGGGRLAVASMGPLAAATSVSRGGGGAAHSFEHFQHSVSDAWEIDEPPSPQVTASKQEAAVANNSGPSAVKSPSQSAPDQNRHSSNITPVHNHIQVLCPFSGRQYGTYLEYLVTTVLSPETGTFAETAIVD
jgi:hypothetical protein